MRVSFRLPDFQDNLGKMRRAREGIRRLQRAGVARPTGLNCTRAIHPRGWVSGSPDSRLLFQSSGRGDRRASGQSSPLPDGRRLLLAVEMCTITRARTCGRSCDRVTILVDSAR